MENKTEIKYIVEEINFDNKLTKTEYALIIEDLLENEWEADNYLDNSEYIINHVDDSAYGFLLNWYITSVKIKTPCELGIDSFLKWYPSVQALKKKRENLFWQRTNHSQGWLSPKGRFYELYGLGVHNEFALNYLNKTHGYGNYDLGFGGSGSDYLEKVGWIRILHWTEQSGINFYNCRNRFKPTDRQKEFLIHFCHQYDLNLTKVLEELY